MWNSPNGTQAGCLHKGHLPSWYTVCDASQIISAVSHTSVKLPKTTNKTDMPAVGIYPSIRGSHVKFRLRRYAIHRSNEPKSDIIPRSLSRFRPYARSMK